MEEDNLRGVLRIWQRKVEIAEIGARRCSRKLKKIHKQERKQQQYMERQMAGEAEKEALAYAEKSQGEHDVESGEKYPSVEGENANAPIENAGGGDGGETFE